jgi:hypothetical protein
MMAHPPTVVLSLTTTASRPPGEDPGRFGTFWEKAPVKTGMEKEM